MTIEICVNCEEKVDLADCKVISQHGRTIHALDRNGKGRSHIFELKKDKEQKDGE
jgi:hypothetical protein